MTVLLGALTLIQDAFCEVGSMLYTGTASHCGSAKGAQYGHLIADMALPAVGEDDAARSAQGA